MGGGWREGCAALAALATLWAPAAAAQSAGWPMSRPRIEVVASSQFGSGEDFAAWRVVDGWATGLWCEGVPGSGLGQTLELRLDEPRALARVEVLGGSLVSGEHFVANDVPVRWSLKSDAGAKAEGLDAALSSSAPADGPSGVTRLALPDSRPVRSLLLTMTGVVERDGPHHGCVSEVRLFPPGADTEGALMPVPLPAKAYAALPADLAALLAALQRCDPAELGARVHFPLGWDIPEQTVRAPGGSVTPMTRLTFRNASELAKTCRERPRELPGPPRETTVRGLLETVFVEAPSAVAVTFPAADGQAESGMRWRLAFRDERWVLMDAER